MYQKDLTYITIEYSDKDLDYIDDLCAYIEWSSDEIVTFLNIQTFGEKVHVKLWDNLESFRKCYKDTGYSLDKKGEVRKWVCGFAFGNDVHTLCLEAYRQTKTHENNTLQDLKYLIMHEFTHSCHTKLNPKKYAWLGEGLATTITHQMENEDKIFNFTLNQAINGGPDYRNYHTMFSYVYKTYGRDYILNLINDYDLLKKVTPKLYEETFKLYGNNE